ncbi:MAG: riboflavin biosynthesis protein RibF [Saprospiraceae bacterium]|nr:riboflavin biosynthesis protein RibF [Saprospiraceae bacterium]
MRVFTDLSTLPAFQNAVITIGSFDGVHQGHRRILEQVKNLASQIGGESVIITFDPHPRTVLNPADKGFKLLTTTTEKIALLRDIGIDHVVVAPFSEAFARQSAAEYVESFLIRYFQPKFIVIGYDHRFGSGREGDISYLKKYESAAGFQVIEISAQEVDEITISSSKIRKALESADVVLANRLLGHPFSFNGRVVEGSRIGRTIGFPTANLELEDPHKIHLPEGIYAARVETNPAALYIGSRPTLSPNGKRVIEVHLIDFEGDLYGANITVDVLDYIRPDKKLENLDTLREQISADKTEILHRLQAMERPAMQSHPVSPMTYDAPQEDKQLPLVHHVVAIVILNYNTRRHLEQYLPSVVAYSQGAAIVVADNGSPDDSISFLQKHYPQITLLDLQQNWGFAEGYNRALQQVSADYYVILNSDVQVAPGWLEPVLKALKEDSALAVAQPKILAWRPDAGALHPTEPYQFEYAGAAGGWIDRLGYPFCRGRIFSQRELDYGQYDDPQECFWAAGAAFFIRADLYHQFGGFDGDYFAHNEEIDLCWRLKRAGYRVACIPDSVVWHLGGGTLEYENPRKVFLNFRNSLYSLLKNEPWSKLLWLLPARLLLDGLAGARFAAKKQYQAIWAIVRAHFSFYQNLSEVLIKRKHVALTIEKHRIGPETRQGIYPGSIILAHYLRRVKKFVQLSLPSDK